MENEIFTKKDFLNDGRPAHEIANEKLAKLIGPKCRGTMDGPNLFEGIPTHEFYLFNIQPIKEKECQHVYGFEGNGCYFAEGSNKEVKLICKKCEERFIFLPKK